MSNDATEPQFSRGRERLILFVLAAVQFTSIVDFVVVMPLGPQLKAELSLTPARFGLIVSSYTYAAGLAGILASMFLDRYARRTAFLTLYTGFLAGTLACGLAPDYLWLLAARVLTGAFGGVLGGMALAIVGDVFPENRRGTATGALMSSFALASVVGVPIGLMLGQKFGWHVPFLTLAVLGIPIFFVAARALPRLDAHLGAKREHDHSFEQLKATFSEPNHLRAFALTISMMFGVFLVIPFLSPYLVSNVGIAKDHLAVVYVAGGVLTLVGAPIAGRLADRFGKLLVYRFVAPMLAVVVLVFTNLPPVTLWLATPVVACLMLCNAGRMVPAMAMITSSVEPRRRGGFLGANSAVQHIAAGLGASVGGFILTTSPDGKMETPLTESVGGFIFAAAPEGTLENFPFVGLLSVAVTILSLWLAGRLRLAGPDHATGTGESLAAAAQGNVDADEPITAAEF